MKRDALHVTQMFSFISGAFFFRSLLRVWYLHETVFTFCLILVFVGSESDIQTGDPAAGKFSFHQQVGEGVNDPDQ